MDELK